MIAVIQRVRRASVTADGVLTGSCGQGLAILLGVARGDEKNDAELLAAKISKLRIFSDGNGKMNLSVNDVNGDIIVVSQFTLLADYSHGNRPDYFNAAPPEDADRLYEYFKSVLGSQVNGNVSSGVFGADMIYEIINDGPVTIVMDSNNLKKK